MTEPFKYPLTLDTHHLNASTWTNTSSTTNSDISEKKYLLLKKLASFKTKHQVKEIAV